MTIRTVKGEFVCTCNECGCEAFGGTQDNFGKFIEELKEEGWTFKKVDEQWEHTCADCVEDALNDFADD